MAPAKPTKLLNRYQPPSPAGTWNSDGTSIVFAAATPEDAPPGYDDLYLLAPAIAPNAEPLEPNPRTSPANCVPRPSTSRRTAHSSHPPPSARATLSCASLSTPKRKRPCPIDLGAAVVSGLNTNRKQTGWVWLADSGGHPMRLCYAAKLGDPCTVLPTPELGPAKPPHRRARNSFTGNPAPSPSKACSICRLTPAPQKSRSSSMSMAAPSARGKTAAIPSPTSSSATAGLSSAPIRAGHRTTASNLPRPTRTTSAEATTRM